MSRPAAKQGVHFCLQILVKFFTARSCKHLFFVEMFMTVLLSNTYIVHADFLDSTKIVFQDHTFSEVLLTSVII